MRMSIEDDRVAQGTLLVSLQFLCLGIWLASGPIAPGGVARLIQLAGLGLGAWAGFVMLQAQRRPFSIHPDPRAHRQLVDAGPYHWIRHPMYTSLIALVLPACISAGWLAQVAGLVLVVTLVRKLRLEEQWLIEHFPDYAAYRARTDALIPKVY